MESTAVLMSYTQPSRRFKATGASTSYRTETTTPSVHDILHIYPCAGSFTSPGWREKRLFVSLPTTWHCPRIKTAFGFVTLLNSVLGGSRRKGDVFLLYCIALHCIVLNRAAAYEPGRVASKIDDVERVGSSHVERAGVLIGRWAHRTNDVRLPARWLPLPGDILVRGSRCSRALAAKHRHLNHTK